MPAYASFLVGYTELNEEQKARDYLDKMYKHFNGPFQVLSEFPHSGYANPHNTFNYLPGYAAFATGYIGAFCGLRLRDFQLDIVYPNENFGSYQNPIVTGQRYELFKKPSPNTESWNVTGLSYRGTKLDILYDMRSRSVTIRNRRGVNDPNTIGDDTLEVLVYEGNEAVVKPLKVGDTVVLNIATETWNYNSKKNKLMKSDIYANNMHILASIYSISYSRYLVRQNDAVVSHGMNLVLAIVCLLSFKVVKFVSN